MGHSLSLNQIFWTSESCILVEVKTEKSRSHMFICTIHSSLFTCFRKLQLSWDGQQPYKNLEGSITWNAGTLIFIEFVLRYTLAKGTHLSLFLSIWGRSHNMTSSNFGHFLPSSPPLSSSFVIIWKPPLNFRGKFPWWRHLSCNTPTSYIKILQFLVLNRHSF